MQPDMLVVPEVTIKNFADMPAKHPAIKKTTVKTYLLDPAGTNIPRQVQIADYEPTRVRTVIQVLDNPVALCTDMPVLSPDTSAAGQPTPQGRLLPPTTAFYYEFFGPDALWINAVQNPANTVLPTLSGVIDTVTGAFAGAAAGNIITPAPGESISGFGVDFQVPGAGTLLVITLSNVLGGPFVWTVSVPATGLSWRPPAFLAPIPAASPTVFPTLAVGALAGGPAYTLTLQGMKTVTQSRVTVTKEYC